MAEGITSFEGFEKDDAFSVWEDNNGISRNAAWARSGGFGMKPTGSLGLGNGESMLLPPTPHFIIGFAFNMQAYDIGSLANTLFIMGLNEPPGTQVALLEFTGQKTFGIRAGSTTFGYTNKSLDDTAWYFVEWRILRASGTGGEVELRINGHTEFLLTGVNTGAPQWGGINQYVAGRIGGGNSGTSMWYDDIYTRNAFIGGFLGDIAVIGTELVADYTTQWVRNVGPSNYLTQIENTPDEDATHVATDIAAKDLYEVADSAFNGVIHAVQLTSRGRKTSTELWRMQNVIHVNGVESFGAQHYMSFPAYETYPSDVFGHQPNGADWTLPAFNAMKAGFYAEPV